MTVIRVVRPQRWTTIDRRPINHAALSFRARGVLVWLLDKPDDTRVNATEISKHGLEGREAIEKALRELRAAGYLVSRKFQVEKGKWTTENWLYEHPSLGAEPAPGNPLPAPDTGPPAPGNPLPNPKSTTPEDCDDQVVTDTQDGAAAVRAALRSYQPPTTPGEP